MKRVCLWLFFLFLPVLLLAESLPQPQGWVNDFANVISGDYRQKLTALIQQVEEKTSSEIAVVTAQSIAPYDEKEYARLLFDNWKPGKKGKDNGVLLLLAVKERRWRIETGYGVEGILPDGLCGEIGRKYMVPYFRQGDYAQGLYAGAVEIAQIIAKNANVNLSALEGVKETEPQETGQQNRLEPIIMLILFLFFLGLFILPAIFGRRGNNIFWGGGYGGSGGGGFGGGGFGGGGFGGFGGGGGGGGGAGGGF